MHAKRFPQLPFPVIITGVTACDNVALDGIQVEPYPPEEAPGDPTLDADEILASTKRSSLDCWAQGAEFSFLSLGDHLDTLHTVLKAYGEMNRSLTILKPLDEDWSILHLDACGKPAYQGAIRPYL